MKKYTGQKLNNMMWLRMVGEFMSKHFHGYDYLANDSFLDCREQASVSVKYGYTWRDKSYISSTVMYLAYMLFH